MESPPTPSRSHNLPAHRTTRVQKRPGIRRSRREIVKKVEATWASIYKLPLDSSTEYASRTYFPFLCAHLVMLTIIRTAPWPFYKIDNKIVLIPASRSDYNTLERYRHHTSAATAILSFERSYPLPNSTLASAIVVEMAPPSILHEATVHAVNSVLDIYFGSLDLEYAGQRVKYRYAGSRGMNISGVSRASLKIHKHDRRLIFRVDSDPASIRR